MSRLGSCQVIAIVEKADRWRRGTRPGPDLTRRSVGKTVLFVQVLRYAGSLTQNIGHNWRSGGGRSGLCEWLGRGRAFCDVLRGDVSAQILLRMMIKDRWYFRMSPLARAFRACSSAGALFRSRFNRGMRSMVTSIRVRSSCRRSGSLLLRPPLNCQVTGRVLCWRGGGITIKRRSVRRDSFPHCPFAQFRNRTLVFHVNGEIRMRSRRS